MTLDWGPVRPGGDLILDSDSLGIGSESVAVAVVVWTNHLFGVVLK